MTAEQTPAPGPSVTDAIVGVPPDRPTSYDPVPEASLPRQVGPEGYVVDDLGDGGYAVFDGMYSCLFLVHERGVILVDAPDLLGARLFDAIASVTDKPVTHYVYAHHHADHVASSWMVRRRWPDAQFVAHADVQRLLVRAQDARRPPVDLALDLADGQRHVLSVGGQELWLDYRGTNHSPGELFVYAPRQKALLHIDIVFPGWAPFKFLAFAQDVPGYVHALTKTLEYDFEHLVAGHVSRLGTREDVEMTKAYVNDLIDACKAANDAIGFVEAATAAGVDLRNTWAAFQVWTDAVTKEAVRRMPQHWRTDLAGYDVTIWDNATIVSESQRIDADRWVKGNVTELPDT